MPELEEGEDEDDGGEDPGLALGGGELPQPATRRPNPATTAGAREIRRVSGWNRMVSVSLLRAILLTPE